MSLSNPQSIANPVQKYYEWKGSDGRFVYWDKEQERNVALPLPAYIVVLDQLNTVRGFSDKKGAGIYANEVRDITRDELNVRAFKGGDIALGTWKEIKDRVTNEGGKFAKSVYAALLTVDGGKVTDIELVNFQFYGSSLSPFFDAKVSDDGAVILLDKNTVQQKKGSNMYYEPIVSKKKVREDILERCVNLDRELQKYLAAKLSKQTEEIESVSDKSTGNGLYADLADETGYDQDDEGLLF